MCVKKRALFQSFGSFFLILFLVGCAGKAFTQKGSWVPENNRISLQDGELHKKNWQTRDLDIEYTYQKKTQNLQISGVVKLGSYLTTGFSTLDDLTLYIYTLDPDGMVLNSKSIGFLGYRRSLDDLGKMTFDRQLQLPANTAAIAFGYSGRVTEGSGGSENRIDWNFWKRPGVKKAH